MNEVQVVVDTNIIFSTLLGKNAEMRKTFFGSEMQLYAPNYVMVELFEKKERIVKLSELKEQEVYELMYRLFERIRFVGEYAVTKESRFQAYQLCKSVDEDDTPLIALSIEMGIKVWTGDKKLKEGLIKQGFNEFWDYK
jgi:predicted nucleic acid-binding protein